MWPRLSMLGFLDPFRFCGLNKEGDGGSGGSNDDDKNKDKKFTQTDLDAIVQERLARERNKYKDYDDLKKFKDEHEKNTEAAQTKALEDQKKYEELKKGWTEKEGNYKIGLTEKDKQINSLKISHALTNELTKLNAYPEAVTILQGMVSLSEDGTPQMDGVDGVGNKIKIPLADGVKKFLEERPYLVKANNQGGGGGNTPPAGSGGGQGEGEVKLADLNTQYLQAVNTKDFKKAQEIKAKMQTYFKSKNISRDI